MAARLKLDKAAATAAQLDAEMEEYRSAKPAADAAAAAAAADAPPA